jgi:hypothetical protein
MGPSIIKRRTGRGFKASGGFGLFAIRSELLVFPDLQTIHFRVEDTLLWSRLRETPRLYTRTERKNKDKDRDPNNNQN